MSLTGGAAVCAANERVARGVLNLKGEGVLPCRILLKLLSGRRGTVSCVKGRARDQRHQNHWLQSRAGTQCPHSRTWMKASILPAVSASAARRSAWFMFRFLQA